jgi:hypothetical protein
MMGNSASSRRLLHAASLPPSQKPALFQPDSSQQLLILTLRFPVQKHFATAAETLPDWLHRLRGVGKVK